jgi:hypothetical protein
MFRRMNNADVVSYGFMGRDWVQTPSNTPPSSIDHRIILVQYLTSHISSPCLSRHYYRYPPRSTKHIPLVFHPIAPSLITPSLSSFIHSRSLYPSVHQLLHSCRPHRFKNSLCRPCCLSHSSYPLTSSVSSCRCSSASSLFIIVVLTLLHPRHEPHHPRSSPLERVYCHKPSASHKQCRLYLIGFQSSP